MTADDIDIRTAPLAGSVLVEANAGTGKTWTVAALYVRLLLERALAVEDVLVLTFGVKATAELKTRIRARLVEVREALERASPASLAASPDALLAHVGATVRDPRQAAARLALAVESFDQAPVFTLHGFCQRVLAEHAFESGAPFVCELAPDETAIVDEVAQDFWRRELAAASPAWAAWLARKKVTPASLADDVRRFMQRPYAEVVGPEAATLAPFEAFLAAHAQAREIWLADATALAALLRPVWNAREHHARFRDAAACFGARLAFPPLKAPIVQFTPAKLKGKADHPFFAAVDALWSLAPAAEAALAVSIAALRLRLARYAAPELARRKRERALAGYNDLVTRLRDALESPQGEALAAALRERYPAALLDEFQDTDPVQAEIFVRVYGAAEGPVYYVGDPKQAIYGFRGADVQAYLDAGRRAAVRRTLRTNWRSVPAQVDAVNAIFAREQAFLDAGIAFHPSEAAAREHAALGAAADFPAPFTLWFLADEGGKPLDKGAANARVADATADAIARLLVCAPDSAPAFVGRDIAVLVPRHRQGRLVREALARHGIASVTYGQDSVYASPEAESVERILLAVAEPGREGLVRGALATPLLGADGAALAAYDADPRAWDEVQARFAGYRDRAAARGFIRMWRELVESEGVPARLLALPDGERRLTDLQHLSELLQAAASRDGLDVGGLARLLARHREGRVGDIEAQLLRLESDEQLVRVLTIHAAKGLEFPVVFCPFLWDGQLRAGADGLAVCHEDGRALVDVGSAEFDARRARAEGEERAERVRLAYVALTRAKHRCVMAWGRVKDAEHSPLAHLLHGVEGQDFKALDEAALRRDLARLAAASGGAIAVVDLPPRETAAIAVKGGAEAAALAAREFRGAIAPAWRVSSFSGLAARRAIETPDHDALPADPLAEPPPRPDAAARTVFAFPRGMRAGTLIHALFERADFADAAGAATAALVERTLAAHDVDASWAPVLRRMLADVLATPLADGVPCLAAIPAAARTAELEFLFPVDADAPELVPGVVPPRGYLRGFIDLVFAAGGRWYVLDWKSNWLGDRVEDYAAARLDAVMGDALYDLQYRLYTAALHRHLAARLPGYDYDTHFGGIFYLFVRGMRPANGAATGVFFARPGRGEIEALSRELSTIGGEP